MRIAALLACLLALAAPARAASGDAAFDAFVASAWPPAQAAGVTRETFERETAGLTPDPGIKAQPAKQGEFSLAMHAYIGQVVNPQKVSIGRSRAQSLADTLSQIERRTGVPSEICLAIWGIESGYGPTQGGHDILRSVATLAVRKHPRRFLPRRIRRGAGADPERHAARKSHRLLGGRDGPAAIHAVVLSEICRQLFRRRPGRYLALQRRCARLDRQLSERLRLEPSPAGGDGSGRAGEFRLEAGRSRSRPNGAASVFRAPTARRCPRPAQPASICRKARRGRPFSSPRTGRSSANTTRPTPMRWRSPCWPNGSAAHRA